MPFVTYGSPTLGRVPLVVLSAAAVLLLAHAATVKLRRPAPTGRALLDLAAQAGLHPRPLHAVRAARVLGGLELAVVAAAVLPGVPAALGEGLVAAAYAGFTLVVLAQLRAARAQGEPVSCGCFGADAPLTVGHALLNAVLATAALVTALDPGARPLGTALTPTTGPQAAALLLAVLLAGLAWAVLTVLPAQQQQVTGSAAARTARA